MWILLLNVAIEKIHRERANWFIAPFTGCHDFELEQGGCRKESQTRSGKQVSNIMPCLSRIDGGQ